MVKIIYIEQLAEVVHHMYSFWYYSETGELIEIPYTNVLKMSLGKICDMISRNNLYYKKQ